MADIKQQHLPNLDPLRFFAAAVVSFYHVDMVLVGQHYKKDYLYCFPFQHGDIAVVFFFVLSGFLITWLLLKEEKQFNKISIKTFYLKRVLRIWPLYFLMIGALLAYSLYCNYFNIQSSINIIDVHQHFALNTVLLLLIAPNVVLLNMPSLGYANPTWSIGVEEQFYLIWPWIIKSKNSLKYIFCVIISVYILSNGLVSKLANGLVNHHILNQQNLVFKTLFYVDKFFTFGYSFRIDAMAIGAIGSYLVFNQSPLLKTIYSKSFQVFIYAVLILLLLFPHSVAYQFYAVIFILIILNLSGPATIFNIRNKMVNYFGKISYGIYMFHLIPIVPVAKLVIDVIGIKLNFSTEILICILSLALTTLLAIISFHTFEKFFLRFRAQGVKHD